MTVRWHDHSCSVCFLSHGCDLGKGHPAELGHICLGYADSLPEQDTYSEIILYDVCYRVEVGAPGNFMADYADRDTLFGPEVIREQT